MVTAISQLLCVYITHKFPSRYLLFQSKHRKHRNNVWNLLKVNNKWDKVFKMDQVNFVEGSL